ncbi:hypothetical protein NDA13_004294 [Ustilago tritici]|nr:hypothetical protein NDA13_004294 [Ustilago tritici]
MMDKGLNNKFERLIALMEAQLEFSRQTQHEERLRHACLSEEDTVVLPHLEDQEGGNKSMIGDLPTPTPALRPRQSVLFTDLDKQSNVNYEKYTSPTGPRYLKPQVDLCSKSRTDPYGNEQEEDASATGESNLLQSKPIATPFPKFNPKDVEIFILEAKAWFKFNQVHEQGQMSKDK